MPETQYVEVKAYHPYPAFYWEYKLAGGQAANIEGYNAYQSGQTTKTVGINATVDDVGQIRCTIGSASAGTPTPGAEGTTTTDWISVSVGALDWAVNPEPKNETIQTSIVITFTTHPEDQVVDASPPLDVEFTSQPEPNAVSSSAPYNVATFGGADISFKNGPDILFEKVAFHV